MRRQITFLVVLVFGYSLILGEDGSTLSTQTMVASTTIGPSWNETWSNETSENSTTTTQETTNTTSSPLGPTTTHPEIHPDPQNNETTDYNSTTSEGPLLNGTTSLPSSSSMNTDPKAEKRVDEGQRFDTASFIGGIILAVGVVALGFFLFKVYQSRKGPRAEYNNI